MKIILASALLLGCAWASAQDDLSPQHARVKGNHSNSPAKKFIGRVAPDFELPTLDGDRLKLSDLRGKAVLLNFWATYCGTCKIEMPWFVELQNEYGPQGLQIIGIALDEASTEDIAEFARGMNVNYPILIGNKSVEKSYDGVIILPISFFLDRDGKVIAREFGLQGRSVYVKHIKRALDQAVSARK
jgi:thiol-disulfide isomerase/thioredoxin